MECANKRKAERGRFFAVSLRLFVAVLIVSIATLNNVWISPAWARDAETWHQSYVPINDSGSQQFLHKALAAATQLFGKPRIAIRSVYLCLSQPVSADGNLKRNFQLTSVEDRKKGIFAIYLTRKPGEYAFNGQLAHEVAHLLNVDVYDPYMEGLCSVFAERFNRAAGLDWSGWKKSYDAYEEPFYAGTYKMMKEVSAKVDDRQFCSLPQFVVQNVHDKNMHIDIKAWLASLSSQQSTAAKAVIAKYTAYVKGSMPRDGRYVFELP